MSIDARAALAAAAPGWSAPLRDRVAARGRVTTAPDGQRLFSPGERGRGFMVLLAGAVRVEHLSESGRAVVLYRIAPGDTCVMTTSCLVTGDVYRAWGYAEGDVTALVLDGAAFQRLMGEDAAFRAMALGVFAERLRELVEVIDELLLHRVDLRLAGWLAARAPEVAMTHQAIAGEMGTAREVVSRILKDFERRGWIALSRGAVAVANPAALQGFSAKR